VHSYSTRLSQRGGFSLPKVKASGSLSVIGAKLWNTLLNTLPIFQILTSFNHLRLPPRAILSKV